MTLQNAPVLKLGRHLEPQTDSAHNFGILILLWYPEFRQKSHILRTRRLSGTLDRFPQGSFFKPLFQALSPSGQVFFQTRASLSAIITATDELRYVWLYDHIHVLGNGSYPVYG